MQRPSCQNSAMRKPSGHDRSIGTQEPGASRPSRTTDMRTLPPDGMAQPARRYLVAGHPIAAASVVPGLHLVATPIGNLGDITLRALATLAGADRVLAEDTRVSKILLGHYGISTPLAAYHEHNAAEMRPKVLRWLAEGQSIALISDAGTPLISDPGYRLALQAGEAGHAVHALPGASAVLTALVLGGLPTDRFLFEGFLPPRSAARRARLTELQGVAATIVLFESPRRLVETLDDIAVVMPHRPLAVARELTKLHEQIHRGTAADLATHFRASDPRGEIVLLIGAEPAKAIPGDGADPGPRLTTLLTQVSLKEAVAQVAAETGLPRRTVYARALALTRPQEA